ncbi:MAG: polysaccharide deacetylase family protein [Fimbriimonadaceae bacterium]|nr:polysaccharide deacetylase family protein [Fimbriimonadaceae bacterium]QYK54916.1 MAG: polysaccharide deacetylase family protein [Fimbriimonadaceae bacterium]
MSQTPRIPILMYHKVALRPERTHVPGHYVAPRKFEAQVKTLRRLGLSSVSVAGLVRALSTGASLGKYICLTFDDGYQDFLDHAAPILERHGMRGTIFAVAGLLGKTNEWDAQLGDSPEPLLDGPSLSNLAKAGHEVGSHSMTHARLTELDPAALNHEVSEAKARLEAVLGQKADIFCYPYGANDETVRGAVANAGYTAACSVDKGWNHPWTDPYRLKRINVRSDTSSAILIWKLWRQAKIDAAPR